MRFLQGQVNEVCRSHELESTYFPIYLDAPILPSKLVGRPMNTVTLHEERISFHAIWMHMQKNYLFTICIPMYLLYLTIYLEVYMYA